jgi:hypothetical protein
MLWLQGSEFLNCFLIWLFMILYVSCWKSKGNMIKAVIITQCSRKLWQIKPRILLLSAQPIATLVSVTDSWFTVREATRLLQFHYRANSAIPLDLILLVTLFLKFSFFKGTGIIWRDCLIRLRIWISLIFASWISTTDRNICTFPVSLRYG